MNCNYHNISLQDLNTIIEPGAYCGKELENSPMNVKSFLYIYVTKHNEDWIVQQAVFNENIYLRAKRKNVWHDWEEIRFTHDEVNKALTIKIEENEFNHKLVSYVNNGYMSSKDKFKLDNIEEKANYYEHPLSHSPSIIEQDDNNQFVTSSQKQDWNSKAPGNHIHQDYLDSLKNLTNLMESANKNIDELFKKSNIIENKLTTLTESFNNHAEFIPQ